MNRTWGSKVVKSSDSLRVSTNIRGLCLASYLNPSERTILMGPPCQCLVDTIEQQSLPG